MTQNKVYLAGAISGLNFGDATDWREYAKKKFLESGINAYSPLRAKDYLADHGTLEGSYEEFPLSTARGIMTRDHWDCKTSDAILVNLLDAERVSIGTVMEMAWAFSYQKPTVLLTNNKTHEHPMINEAIGYKADNLEDGIKIIKAILLPG